MKPQIEQTVAISTFLNIIFYTFALLLNLRTLKIYVLSPALLIHQKGDDKKITREINLVIGLGPIIVLTGLALFTFLMVYYFEDGKWTEALGMGLATALPFLIASASIGLVGLMIVFIIGTCGYIVHINRN